MSLADPPSYPSPAPSLHSPHLPHHHAPYTDIDLISLRSAAPSYTSSLPPSYSFDIPSSGPTTSRSQPQYRSLIPSSAGPSTAPAHHQFNVASWPSLSNQSQSRAYLNVAARRARREEERAEGERLRNVLLRAESTLDVSEVVSAPPNGRQQRGRQREDLDAAMVADARAWDFFRIQVQDWEQRQISWRAFKERHEGRRKKKGKWSLYGRFG